ASAGKSVSPRAFPGDHRCLLSGRSGRVSAALLVLGFFSLVLPFHIPPFPTDSFQCRTELWEIEALGIRQLSELPAPSTCSSGMDWTIEAFLGSWTAGFIAHLEQRHRDGLLQGHREVGELQ